MPMTAKAGCRKINGAWVPTIWADDDLGQNRVLWTNENVKFDDREDAAQFAVDHMLELVESGRLRMIPRERNH